MKNRPSAQSSKLSYIFSLYSFVILIVVNVLWFIDEEFHQMFAGWLFIWGLTNNSCKPPKDSLAIWHQRVIEFRALQVWESKLATNRIVPSKFASCISELLKSPPVRSTHVRTKKNWKIIETVVLTTNRSIYILIVISYLFSMFAII